MLTNSTPPLLALALYLLGGAAAAALTGLPALSPLLCDGRLIGVDTDTIAIQSCLLPDASVATIPGPEQAAVQNARKACGRFIAGYIDDTFVLLSVSAYEQSGKPADIRYCTLDRANSLRCTGSTVAPSNLAMTPSLLIESRQFKLIVKSPQGKKSNLRWGMRTKTVDGAEKTFIYSKRFRDHEYICIPDPE
ncbi:MAG: hypothetical protein M1829_000180 [Trizodia sp. TS-e1964]|nr:MAG: hypothetical protein M1829_000180 [Trizodia sp. TS-e1964]